MEAAKLADAMLVVNILLAMERHIHRNHTANFADAAQAVTLRRESFGGAEHILNKPTLPI